MHVVSCCCTCTANCCVESHSAPQRSGAAVQSDTQLVGAVPILNGRPSVAVIACSLVEVVKPETCVHFNC